MARPLVDAFFEKKQAQPAYRRPDNVVSIHAECPQICQQGIREGMLRQGSDESGISSQLRYGRSDVDLRPGKGDIQTSGDSLLEALISRRGQTGHDFTKSDNTRRGRDIHGDRREMPSLSFQSKASPSSVEAVSFYPASQPAILKRFTRF